MAANIKTKVTILLVLNIIVKIQCENNIVRPTKYAMPIAEEPLLRSSDDIPERTITDDVSPTISEVEESVDTTKHITTAAPVVTENAYDPTDNVFTTVSNTEINEDIPEALGLTNEETNLTEDLPENDRANETIEVTTAVNDETAMVTDVVVDKDSVDKQTATFDDNVEEEPKASTKTETSSTVSSPPPSSSSPVTISTMPAVEDNPTVGPRVTRFEEDRDALGQRSPKTDNAEPVIIETRSFDVSKTRSSPEASQSSTLRDWLEDPWLRSPPGILVPLRPMALSRALAVWRDLTSGRGINVSDIVVIGYDANGVNWRSKHNLRHSSGSDKRAVTEVLSKLLRKYQDVRTNDISGDGTMKALTLSSKLVPFDSALFIITDRGPADPQRVPLAVRALVEKRLKVYTIWTDPAYPSEESEKSLQELRNISAHTEGDVLPYSLEVMDVEGMDDTKKQLDVLEPQARMAKLNSDNDEKMETLVVKRGGGGAISLGVPLEAGVTALRVYIEGAVDHAVLYPPNDAPQIDLYNQTSVALYSRGSRTDSLSPRDIYLAFTGDDSLSVLPVSPRSPATAGVWHFSMRCDTCDYRLTIGAAAAIHFTTHLLDADSIRLRVVGPVSTVRDSALVDEYGTELSKLTFSYQPAAGGGEHPQPGEQEQELVSEVPLPSVKASRVYAKIVGRDVHGESFVRLSGPLNQVSEIRTGRSASVVFPDSFNDLEMAEEYNQRGQRQMQYNDSSLSGRATSQVVNQLGILMTTVQIGLSTRLYGAPGESFTIQYEVANYRDQTVFFRFGAVGELGFLNDINPKQQYVAPGQSVIVIVRVVVKTDAQPGARDFITFTAYGLDRASISSYIYVTSADGPPTDIRAPELTHSFQGTCMGKMGDDCAQHVWSANVVARDNDAGLLRVSSSPPGLLYAGNFVAGTRDSVVSTYRATCCAPRLLVTAVDAMGNAQSYNVDISNYFTPASIAPIVLGVFLFIALILIIASLIFWCVRRRRESKELSYTARREIS